MFLFCWIISRWREYDVKGQLGIQKILDEVNQGTNKNMASNLVWNSESGERLDRVPKCTLNAITHQK